MGSLENINLLPRHFQPRGKKAFKEEGREGSSVRGKPDSVKGKKVNKKDLDREKKKKNNQTLAILNDNFKCYVSLLLLPLYQRTVLD